jgi:hypothetical protein
LPFLAERQLVLTEMPCPTLAYLQQLGAGKFSERPAASFLVEQVAPDKTDIGLADFYE